MPSTKQLINNNISIKLLGKQTKNKSKSKRKNQNRANDKKVLQSKPSFSNFQYPQPIIINPQQQKQLDENYSNKLATLMQKKFDEEYAKKENEKATQKMNRVGAFQAVDNGNGFSQPVNLLSKRNDTFERPTLQSESEQQPRINPIVQSQLRPNLVKFNPPVDYYAEPVDGYATTEPVQGELLNPLWHCDICNRTIQERSKKAHIESKVHQKKLKEQQSPPPAEDNSTSDSNTVMVSTPNINKVPKSLQKSPAYEASLIALTNKTDTNINTGPIDETKFDGSLADLFKRSKLVSSDVETSTNPLTAYENKLKADNERVFNTGRSLRNSAKTRLPVDTTSEEEPQNVSIRTLPPKRTQQTEPPPNNNDNDNNNEDQQPSIQIH